MSALAVGVDLGGTNLRAALVDETGGVVREGAVPTGAADGPDAVIGRIADLVRSVAAGSEVRGAAVASPGPLDRDRTVVRSAPNLPGWRDVPLPALLSERTRLPVVMENDANAAAYGEAIFGAGKGASSVLYVGLGTGVGSGVVLDGRLLRGAHGAAAELGHVFLGDPDGPRCGCGRRGCLETYASATGVARRYRELTASPPGEVAADAAAVAEAARTGDEAARRAYAEAVDALAHGLSIAVHLIDPEVIVLGGGVAASRDLVLDPLAETLPGRLIAGPGAAPILRPSVLEGRAGTVGAAALLLGEG
jgi:glucokinase